MARNGLRSMTGDNVYITKLEQSLMELEGKRSDSNKREVIVEVFLLLLSPYFAYSISPQT